MRRIPISFYVAILVSICNGQPPISITDTLKIIFVGGQSNMLSLRADANSLPVSDMDSTIAFYYHTGLKPGTHATPFIATSDSTWIHLKTQIQVPYITLEEQFFGPEMTLARTLALNGVKNLGVFKIGYGGTHLAHDWKKGDNSGAELYKILMGELTTATDSLTSWEIPWKFIGMAWMQGETDGSNSQWAADYAVNLTEFIANVRNDFNSKNMPVVLGKIANTGVYAYSELVRTAQIAVADSDPLVTLIDLDDLPMSDDRIHYTTDGIMAMGARMGEALLSTTSIDSPPFADGPTMKAVLHDNYPNPFNPITNIGYTLLSPSNVTLAIYDVTGRIITTLKDTQQPIGYYDIKWNGRDKSGNDVSTGIYLCLLQADDYSKTIKIVYLK